MAHKGMYTRPPEWWKHLRKEKKTFNGAERTASKKAILQDVADVASIGLHKSEEEMRELKRTAGKSVIPKGIYCESCPYHDVAEKKHEQSNGFCWYIMKGDWELEIIGMLWDGCKECGIYDDEPEMLTEEVK